MKEVVFALSLMVFAIAWLSVVLIALRLLGPIIGAALRATLERIEEKNPGLVPKEVYEKGLVLAKEIAAELDRSDLSDERRAQALVGELVTRMRIRGMELGQALATNIASTGYDWYRREHPR
jgi:hypothetical protein